MPELIECRVMAETLRKKIFGKTLHSIKTEAKFKGAGISELKLPLVVDGVDSYGKKIFIRFKNRQYLVNAPLMDGRWLFKKGNNTRAVFKFDDFEIYYDVSRFGGGVDVISDPIKFIIDKKLGPDPFLRLVSKEEFCERFRKKTYQKHEISKALLNQDIIVGIGNWMKAEILYEAKINPHRLVSNITDEELETCRVKMYEVIDLAYQNKGLTVHSYWSPDGSAGTYPRKVYGLKQDPHGNPITHEPNKGNIRGNDWVPNVQK
ncbi:MAG: formamidopyrimidine-DNA glycosylase [Solumvirus sp.]|uniref:Formamidopyrimidine-DNA glycosylase n=1 Tax=Solumvirus sp. TaxID=2487773 RepID=A0A3G5AGS2_9VIRU|nr:MAG: formamidopyrimidine-DNA glycosylase [Solumvirus sp.]